MQASQPIIAIIDDYQGLVPGLAAFARLRAALPAADIRVITSQPLQDADIAAMSDVTYLVLIRERSRITAALLDRLPALKAIVQTGTAGDAATSHIDREACAQRGVAVLEGGASDGHSAAEITWALILNASRHVHVYINSMAEGRWQQAARVDGIGRSLRGQTLGILGYGRIGQLLRGYAQAFGMNVLVWGRERSRDTALAHQVPVATSREALFEHSDVLVLQMRMNESSRHSVTLSDLQRMKPTALLVNTSRPALIEPGALAAALQQGRPGRAAVDVHDTEPLLQPDALTALPQCLATPHIGYVEAHSYETLFDGAFQALLAFLGRDDHATVL